MLDYVLVSQSYARNFMAKFCVRGGPLDNRSIVGRGAGVG